MSSPRDGTSQKARALPELDPDFARLDERSSADLVEFARSYAGELRYFAPGSPERTTRTWSGFVPADGAPPRPHYALFLAFLELLGRARAELNTLTRRHLEFFYRDVLRMFGKAARPDRVHVLAELDERTPEVRLPAGTALAAGKDSLGRALAYRTERELVANRVEVARVSAQRAELRRTGIRDAARRHLVSGTPEEAFVGMLQIALSEKPGDPLTDGELVLRFRHLTDNYEGLLDIEIRLGMPRFDDFRSLRRLALLRASNDADDWKSIGGILAAVARKRTGNAQFQLKSQADFEAMLAEALGMTKDQLARLYAERPEVGSADDAYRLRGRPDVAGFIRERLTLEPEGNFAEMMRVKTRMDDEWREIDRLLEAAGARKQPGFRLPELGRDLKAKVNAVAALEPKISLGHGLDEHFMMFPWLESYFHMPAEDFKYMMSVAVQSKDAGRSDWSWNRVYDIVTAAHREMLYAKRRADLFALAAPDKDGLVADPVKALDAMLEAVLGERVAQEEWTRRLRAFGVGAGDQEYLSGIAEGTEKAPDWTRVLKLLETARRNREGYVAPPAEKVEWRNLYPTADARTPPRWKTFGAGETPREPAPAPAASFGLALLSPLLVLGEGRRTVTLLLGFAGSQDFAVDYGSIRVELSTAKGWLEVTPLRFSWADEALRLDAPDAGGGKLPTLHLSLELGEKLSPIVPLSRQVHGVDAPGAALRLMVKPVWDAAARCYVTPAYEQLRAASLLRTSLFVGAEGLEKLALANDLGALDPKKPFEPFGGQPAAGARFYLGHPELAGKSLATIAFRAEWMGLPASLGAHYAAYPGSLNEAAFRARVSLVDAGSPAELTGSLVLFGDPGAIHLAPGQAAPTGAAATEGEVTRWSRYLVWELLAPDLQHSAYPSVALGKSIELAAALAKPPDPKFDPKTFQVNPPYTPKAKSLKVDYTASEEGLRLFHVHPFGFRELVPERTQPGFSFLPQFDFEGELYIGLRNVSAPQNVALLFRMAEGSADPDLAPGEVRWWYLNGDVWRSLQDEGGLLADGTRGLIQTGVVELALKPALPGTLLPADLYWIRATIDRAPQSVCEMVDLHPNAVTAVFTDADNAPEHLAVPLPAGTITAPATPIPGLAAVRQPYSSFGGKMAETDASFYVRVSERLRHKERAVTAWDYERLVLEKFPQLYKVKCLRGPEPGRVELIVIPDVRNQFPFDPFEPKAPADLLRDIEAFLRERMPASAAVEVKNPRYVPVRVRCGVRFMPGQDEGYCRRRLNEELNRFLSPWAYDEGADIEIGGSAYANSIINFIDDRDYVDYLFQFKLFTGDERGEHFTQVEEDAAGYRVAAPPGSVLVGVRQHELDVASQADYRVEGFAGVNYMQIEFDFIVS